MISKTSQKWILLNYLKKNPNKKVLAIDFQWNWFKKPLVFIWAKPGSRLSELLKLKLIEKCWKKEWKKVFCRKAKDSDYYKISELWLNYNLV